MKFQKHRQRRKTPAEQAVEGSFVKGTVKGLSVQHALPRDLDEDNWHQAKLRYDVTRVGSDQPKSVQSKPAFQTSQAPLIG